MKPRLVVSDTSTITALIQINRADLLEAMFESVLIPAEVKRELTAFHATIPAFIQTREVSDHLAVESLLSLMDTGEAEAIVLALRDSSGLHHPRRSRGPA